MRRVVFYFLLYLCNFQRIFNRDSGEGVFQITDGAKSRTLLSLRVSHYNLVKRDEYTANAEKVCSHNELQ